tara:strand:- start:1 stop:882 length:882 start_codon:yes stop_codon:yes gene_type:complete
LGEVIVSNVWRVGDVVIKRIVEIESVGGSRFILPDATREACLEYEWLQPHFMDEKGNLKMSIHALVVDTGEKVILVDTCVGNDKQRNIPAWSNLQTNFLERLEEAGYPPGRIDIVLCTHLHVDHVGWNTMLVGGKWVPTFPNARYLIGRKEWEYWERNEDESVYGSVLADSVKPIFEEDLVDLVEMDEKICVGVELEPSPGHTPGHVSVKIESSSNKALITGDFMHHPVQMTRTDWCSSADTDPIKGRATREAMLAEYLDTDVLLIGTHFASPTAGYVRSHATGAYWLDTRVV